MMSAIKLKSILRGSLTVFAAAAFAGGCGPKTQSGPSPQPPAAIMVTPTTPPAPAPPAAPAPSTPAVTPTAPAAQPASPAGAPTSSPVAKADGEVPGTRVEVQGIKRSSTAVTLTFTIVNDSQKPLSVDNLYVHGTGDPGSTDAVYLVDTVAKKKYLAIHDSENHCVCAKNPYSMAPGDRANLWVKFPAPPASVQKIGVVIPGFQPMDDVPIAP